MTRSALGCGPHWWSKLQAPGGSWWVQASLRFPEGCSCRVLGALKNFKCPVVQPETSDMFEMSRLKVGSLKTRPGHFTPSSTNENALICSCLPKHSAFPKQKGHAKKLVHPHMCLHILSCSTSFTSSTAQGGGGSFKNRKPIGEIGCCESGMAERSH